VQWPDYKTQGHTRWLTNWVGSRVEVVKNGFTLAMIGLMLMTEPPLHSTESQNLEADCVNADFTTVGRPVMFPARGGIVLGISTPRTTFGVGDAVLIYVWVNNQMDKEGVLGSCRCGGIGVLQSTIRSGMR
jgi:hypothetical protein